MAARAPLRKVLLVGSRRAFSTTRNRQASYGFIGLGQMGYQMAKNLQAKLTPADTLTVYDINTSTMEKLVAEMTTPKPGASIGAAVVMAKDTLEMRNLDTVITALPEPRHVQSLFERLTGLSASATSPPSPTPSPSTGDVGTVFLDCSTIDPGTSRLCAALVSAAAAAGKPDGIRPGSLLLDAPMSGGVVGAAAGTLTFMLGGADPLPAAASAAVASSSFSAASATAPLATAPSAHATAPTATPSASSTAAAAAAARAEPVLRLMGSRVLRCGAAQGTGLAAKLANNYLLAIQNAGAAEAMALGASLGVEPAVLAAVVNASTGRCWATEINNPVPGVVPGAPAGRGYAGGFGIALMRKDLGLALKAADQARSGGGAEGKKKLRLEMGGKAADVYEAAEAEERCKGRDFSVVYRWVVDE